MRRIWKYMLRITDDEQKVSMPPGAQILSAQFQENESGTKSLYIWAMVDIALVDHAERTIRIYGTGNPIEQGIDLRFINTVQQGRFVWHVFEVI